MKITKIKTGIIPKIKYNNSNAEGNAWENSNLEKYLNQETPGGYYYSLSNEAKNMIETGTWNVGAAYVGETVSEIYSNSIKTTIRRKVGVIAAYEYLYATNNKLCYEIIADDYDSNDCINKNWLNPKTNYDHHWTVTPSNYASHRVLTIRNNGGVNASRPVSDETVAHPVVYLKSSVKITGGTGTSEDPYTLSM